MKVLHTADTHLGDLTGPTKDGQNLRRLDTLRCMEATFTLPEEQHQRVNRYVEDYDRLESLWEEGKKCSSCSDGARPAREHTPNAQRARGRQGFYLPRFVSYRRICIREAGDGCLGWHHAPPKLRSEDNAVVRKKRPRPWKHAVLDCGSSAPEHPGRRQTIAAASDEMRGGNAENERRGTALGATARRN